MKLTESQLRRIIRNETKTVIKEFTHPRRGLASLIFEEDEKKPVDNDKGMINIAAGPESVLKAASSLIADEEKKKIFMAGLTDGDPADEVVSIKGGSASAASLIPTQSEIGSSQSLDDQIKDKYGNLDVGINGGTVKSKDGDFPVLTFGNYILDGHHRWSQVYATNPESVIKIAKISAPGVKTPEAALGMVHALLFALYGKSPTKPFQGENLFSMSADDIKKYVKENIVDSALKKLADAKLIPSADDKDAAAEMYAKNLEKLKAQPGQFSRTLMPQPGDAGAPDGLTTVPDAAAAGKVNFMNPKSADVKDSYNRSGVMIVERWQKLAGIIK
jgi:hypothetical protein